MYLRWDAMDSCDGDNHGARTLRYFHKKEASITAYKMKMAGVWGMETTVE